MAPKNEYRIQADFIRYIELMYPDLLYTISPAGFIMSAGMAMKMMRMGYRKGTPDVMFFEPRGVWHGLLIEFKDPKGVVSEAQIEFLRKAEARGYWVDVCRTTTAAINQLEVYLAIPPTSTKNSSRSE